MDEIEAGPEIVKVDRWSYFETPVYKGDRAPHPTTRGGPAVMTVRCTKCNRGPWRVTEGPDVIDERWFHLAGVTVQIYCDSCHQARAWPVAEIPGYA